MFISQCESSILVEGSDKVVMAGWARDIISGKTLGWSGRTSRQKVSFRFGRGSEKRESDVEGKFPVDHSRYGVTEVAQRWFV